MMRRETGAYRWATAGILLGWLLLAHRFWFVTDDAFISFRYAVNFAEGNGLRYNLGFAAPVEGYSNLLWVLYAALLHTVGASLQLFMPITCALCALGLLLRVQRAAARRFGLNTWQQLFVLAFVGLSPSFALWSSSGLETMPFTLAIFFFFESVVLDDDPSIWKGLLAGVALLTLRPEGFLWIGGIVGCALLVLQQRGSWAASSQHRRRIFILGGCALAFALLVAWRLYYYGRPFPLTVYAKSGLSVATLGRGLRYLAEHGLTFPAVFLVIPAAWQTLRQSTGRDVWLPALVMALAPMAYAVGVGGDFMAMGRYLLPGLPFLALLIARLPDLLGAEVRTPLFLTAAVVSVFAVQLSPSWDIHLAPHFVRAKFHFRHNSPTYRSEYQQWEFMRGNTEKWKYLGLTLREISRPGDTVVMGAIGNLGFYSGLDVYDFFGLVTPEVARLPTPRILNSPGHDKFVPPEFFLPHRPTFLRAIYFSGPDGRAEAEAQLAEWHGVQHGYAPEIIERSEPQRAWVVVLRRTERG